MEPISGEQYRAMQQPYQRKKPNAFVRFLPFVAMTLIVGGVSFFGGIHYQKNKQGTATQTNLYETAPTTQRFGGGPPNQQMRLRGALGGVTAVSSTSVSVRGVLNDTVNTYGINESTRVVSDSVTANISDIKIGDRIMVVASTADEKVAAEIMLNPPEPGGGSFSQEPIQFNAQ
jgi:hypothetical protein